MECSIIKYELSSGFRPKTQQVIINNFLITSVFCSVLQEVDSIKSLDSHNNSNTMRESCCFFKGFRWGQPFGADVVWRLHDAAGGCKWVSVNQCHV